MRSILVTTIIALFLVPGVADAQTWKRQAAINTQQMSPSALELSPDGKLLASAGFTGTVKIWDTQTGKLRGSFALPKGSQVMCASFSGDGKNLVAVSQAGNVVVWDVALGKQQKALQLGPKMLLSAAALSPDGKSLLTANGESDPFAGVVPGSDRKADGTVTWWDLDSGKPGKTLAAHKLSTATLAFSADGKVLLSVGSRPRTPQDGPGVAESDNTVFEVKVWDAEGTKCVTMRGGSNAALSGDGKTVALTAQEGQTFRFRLDVLDAATGKKSAGFALGNRVLYGLGYAPDGKTAVTGEDGAARLWDVAKGTLRTNLAGHRGLVMKMVFSRDGTLLATGDSNGLVQVWKSSR